MGNKACSSCGKFVSSTSNGGKCKRCARKKGICIDCNKEKWMLSLANRCSLCAGDKSIQKHLVELESIFAPKSEYNLYLFALYLKYLRRFWLDSQKLHQEKLFMAILEEKDFFAFTSWTQIRKESELFKATYGKIPNMGCPFIKTGRMLEELGALDFKQNCVDGAIDKINQIPIHHKKNVMPFMAYAQSGRSQKTLVTIVEVLIAFIKWLESHNRIDLMTVNADDINSFLAEVNSRNITQNRVSHFYSYLGLFYRWSFAEKHILYNPYEKLKFSKPPPRLLICSELQCRILFNFIQAPSSPSEEAFLLALILIWALSSEELRFAKIEFDGTITITLLRRKLINKKYYNREQLIKLPNSPPWFYKLQIRFYKRWLTKYESLEKSVPHQYLVLPKRRNVHPLTKSSLLRRVINATQIAIGERIPPAVLRKTSGHLHSQQGDASILATLGWSTAQAFDYTWTPKSVYQPSPNTSQPQFTQTAKPK